MSDGSWQTQSMEEGVNQGCPLSAVLAALVLHELITPLIAKLNARAAARHRRRMNGDMSAFSDDDAGGMSFPMAYIDDMGVFIPHEDLLFFLDEFNRLGPEFGCHINARKTRIMLSTSGHSALPAIEEEYGTVIADQVRVALARYSVEEVLEAEGNKIMVEEVDRAGAVSRVPLTQPYEEMEGLRLLGQPIGSTTFAHKFFRKKLKETQMEATKLLQAVPDHQTALRLFSMCTMHKLPHLLGAEVMYGYTALQAERWDEWLGPLASGIDEMASTFLASLTQRESVPLTSMLIAYMSVAQGGLGLMDATTRAIPDFVLTMSQAMRYARFGFDFKDDKPALKLHHALADLFCCSVNTDSKFLKNFCTLYGEVGDVAAPKQCRDFDDYLLKNGSFKSARDRIKQAASKRRRASLVTIATGSADVLRQTGTSPDLQMDLDEILIASSSFPIIHMTRSNPTHRLPNGIFMINLKMKLHLELFPRDNCPTCLCGQTIDPFGKHTFCCRRVSKMVCHNRIRDGAAPVLKDILLTAGIIGKGSKMEIEPKRVVADLPGLRPFDLAFRPVPSLKQTHLPPCPYTRVGIDVTVTSPKGHVPPSQAGAASTNQSANAAKHLTSKERGKLMRDGKCDPYNNTYLSGEEIIEDLLATNQVLIPMAVSPYGRWGPMFHNFLFGKCAEKYTYRDNRKAARKIDPPLALSVLISVLNLILHQFLLLSIGT